MANLIEKTDIKTYVQFTDNIEDRMVDNHISNVQVLEVQPLIDETMWTNIQEILTNPSHSYPELETFYENYIKRWVCFLTAYSIYTWQGKNITQYGIRVMNEDTSTQIAPSDLAVLLGNIKQNANAAYNLMRKALGDADYEFDGITYNDPCKRKGVRTGIARVGLNLDKKRNNYRTCEDSLDCCC